MSKLQLLDSMEAVAQQYQMDDMVIATTNAACTQWTELLAPVAQERFGEQKYHVKAPDSYIQSARPQVRMTRGAIRALREANTAEEEKRRKRVARALAQLAI